MTLQGIGRKTDVFAHATLLLLSEEHIMIYKEKYRHAAGGGLRQSTDNC
jgi:hypothetical protein